MRTPIAFALILLAMACPAAEASDGDLMKLAWLGGCWKSENAEAGSLEHWMSPAGGSMLGMSRTVRKGVTVEFEFMQIVATNAGTLVFIAKPSGQSEASFSLLRLSENEAAFENLQHDFPQRIIYRLDQGKLHARIEGKRNGSIHAVDFPMTRTNC